MCRTSCLTGGLDEMRTGEPESSSASWIDILAKVAVTMCVPLSDDDDGDNYDCIIKMAGGPTG